MSIPCACSNDTSLGELGKDAALLFDPYDSEAIAASMKRLLSEPELRTELIEAGRRRAAEFSWKKHVERIMDAIEKADL